ncbi:MAG: TCR/Tet family MFS transporter [Nitrospira sp. CG24D]|nr:MAG: TCR/Tet family MFS transporter [Nitrospira sp. CG24D]
MTAVLRMCDPVTTPCPPTPAIRMLKRFAMGNPPYRSGLCFVGNSGCGSGRLRKKFLIAITLSQILLRFFADILRELIPIVLNGLGVFHDLVGRNRILNVAGGVGLNVSGPHFTGDQHGFLDDAGKIGMVFGLGFILGPALGGWLGAIDPRLPFWGAAALSLLNACYGFFVLPESLPREKRAPFAWKRANPVGSLVLLRSHHELFGLATLAFLGYLAHAVLPSIAVLYMGYRYGWDTASVGLMLAGVGVAAMIVQGLLIRPLTARFGERTMVLAGLLCGATGFAIYGVAPQGWIFCLGIPIMAFWGLAGPATQALMTRRVSGSEQGRLQGAMASINGVTGLIGPTLFTQIFAHFIGAQAGWQLPGAPFLLAACLLLIGAGLAWRVTRSGP